MDANFLDPLSASGPKLRQIRDAQEMQQAVLDRANRTGEDLPPYEFLELIGKGTYGRVYKSKSMSDTTQQIVAVKIIEADKPDMEAPWEARDDTIQNFTKEIAALQRLKDSNAKNITMIYEAFAFNSQLWLVSEYCQGGSVHTLMKACKDRRVEEDFIIPIARELAVALKYIHDADIVHRDIKCANILIMENGTLRLADFGIAGMFESNVAKRRTIIGTPHWMPLEMVEELGNDSPDISYGTEVDCWAYGCAVYEMAAGHGPNVKVRPQDLAKTLRRNAPRLDENGPYSDKLRGFVEFCLQIDPEARPTTQEILLSPYIAGTSKRYPTESLQLLVESYYAWERSGGERKSLFWDIGAQGPDELGEEDPEAEEWYFSTTLEFQQRLENEAHESLYDSLNPTADDSTPTGPQKLSAKERHLRAVAESNADRGAKALAGLFDPSAAPYSYSDRPERPELQRRASDLPFRNMGVDKAADRTTMIDLDEAGAGFSVPNLADISTLRAPKPNRYYLEDSDEEDEDEQNTYPRPNRDSNRKTTDWKMPLNSVPPPMSAPADPDYNRRTVDWKFPSMTVTDTNEGEQNLQTARKDSNADAWNNRDTMAFSFPMGGLGAAQDAESLPLPLPSRPGLQHSVTMPVAASEPSVLAGSPDRSSMIDLDLAMPEMSRPSTALSNASYGAESTVVDPFDLEDERSELTNTTSQTYVNSNRASLHRPSQSEPNARSSRGSDLEADLDDPWHMRDQSTASEVYSQSVNGDRRLFDPLNEMRARERRRMYNNASNRDSAESNGTIVDPAIQLPPAVSFAQSYVADRALVNVFRYDAPQARKTSRQTPAERERSKRKMRRNLFHETTFWLNKHAEIWHFIRRSKGGGRSQEWLEDEDYEGNNYRPMF